MNAALRRLVRIRASERCEYCKLPEFQADHPFQFDHITAEKHDGTTDARNLALACYPCNVYKGPNIAGIDPRTSRVTRLFHPRRDHWRRHFLLRRNGMIDGRTASGRATVAVLRMNVPDMVALRAALILETHDYDAWLRLR